MDMGLRRALLLLVAMVGATPAAVPLSYREPLQDARSASASQLRVHQPQAMFHSALRTLALEMLLECVSPCGDNHVLAMLTPVEADAPSQMEAEPGGRLERAPLVSALVAAAFQSGTTFCALLFVVLAHAAQYSLPYLTAAGARVAHSVQRGEGYRSVTSLFLHADPVHCFRTCAFGIGRLVPSGAAIFGGLHCALILLLAGLGGNTLALALGHGSGNGAMAVGASAALMGLDGALTAYSLRNPRSYGRSWLSVAWRRGLMTWAVACLRPVVGRSGRSVAVDHTAHAGGYACGLLAGLMLSPHGPSARKNVRERLMAQMSDSVCEQCGDSSVSVERAMLAYLRSLPRVQRKAALQQWRLGESGHFSAGESPPTTEDWPDVFARIKDMVLEHHAPHFRPPAAPSLPPLRTPSPPSPPSPPALAASPSPAGASAAESSQAQASATPPEDPRELERRRKQHRLRAAAEDAAWRHFTHRAEVAMPYIRLLQHVERGQIPLRQLRRWRVDVGALVPSWLADIASTLMLAYAAVCCHLALQRAREMAALRLGRAM